MAHLKLIIAAIVIFQCIFLVTSLDECNGNVKIGTKTTAKKSGKSERLSKSESDDRPAPDQKSLMIVFDTTGSMSADLAQLRGGAVDIVNTFSMKDNNPIYNYVLSLFNDPTVEEPLVTRDPSVLMERLNAVRVSGGGDCPELAIRGLINALENTLPNSQAFLFSDASAKDYELYDEAASLIQRRQASVNFLLTGNCGEQNEPGFKVYEKIARTGGGQVFSMDRYDVRDVLVAMSVSLENDFVSLQSIDNDEAGKTVTLLELDDTVRRLSVSLSGANAQLSVKDSRNVQVTSNETFFSDNIQIITFDAADNKYTIEASAQSAFSVRVGGNSDLKFEFGFSRQKPTTQAETYIRPIIGHDNILSIFVSDSSLIKCLSRATVVPASTLESFDELEIPLTGTNGFFTSDFFEVPSKMFRIRIFGYDTAGNVIDRIISTGIESVGTMIPEVEIDYETLLVESNGKTTLNCIVKSLTTVNVTWLFDGEILDRKTADQSTNLPLTIKNFGQKNVGNYSCIAENDVGRDSRHVTLNMRSKCTSECPIEGFGNIPNYKNCNLYYECVKGIQEPRKCPDGKKFDSVTAVCGDPQTSVCASSVACSNL